MASKMIRQHDGFDVTSPFGNPFRFIFPKGSYSTSKLVALQSSFEQTFADNLTRLKPGGTGNFPTLSWMRQAVDSLFENHKLVKTLVADLEYPSALWDEKWIEFFLYDSVKLLDVCIVLISEVSRLEQQQILLRYALQLLDFSCPASPEQLQRATGALSDWMQKLQLRSPKLKNAPDFLQSLKGTLHFPKVKNSAKGKVLMRAFYAMKIHMIFVSSVLLLVLSGCSNPSIDLQIPNDLPWANAFNDLQASVNTKLKNSSLIMPKELHQVDASSRYLHGLISSLSNRIDFVEEARRSCGETILGLSKDASSLDNELELLVKQLDGFFRLIMSERDALICTVRTNEKEKSLKG